MIINNYYETTDLPMAATLVALGMSLESLDHSDPRRAKFIFKRVQGLDDLLEAYWKKELKIEPISFAMAQKFLKNQLFSRQ